MNDAPREDSSDPQRPSRVGGRSSRSPRRWLLSSISSASSFLNVRNATDVVTVADAPARQRRPDDVPRTHVRRGPGPDVRLRLPGPQAVVSPEQDPADRARGGGVRDRHGHGDIVGRGQAVRGTPRGPLRRPVHGRRDGPGGGLLRGARVSRPALRRRDQDPGVALRQAAGRARGRRPAPRARSDPHHGVLWATRLRAASSAGMHYLGPLGDHFDERNRSWRGAGARPGAHARLREPRLRRRRVDPRPLRRLGLAVPAR